MSESEKQSAPAPGLGSPGRRIVFFTLFTLCFFQFLIHCLVVSHENSLHYDETMHVMIGYSHLVHEAYGVDFITPEHGVSPFVNAGWAWIREGIPSRGSFPNYPAEIMQAAREANIGLGVIMGILLCVIAWRIWGPVAGFLAAFAYTFDPMIIAHSSIVSTDLHAAFFSLLVMIVLWWCLTELSPWKTVALGATVAFAIGAKLSLMALIPIIVLAFVFRNFIVPLRARTDRTMGLLSILTGLVAFAVTAVLVSMWGELGHESYVGGGLLSRWAHAISHLLTLREESWLRYFEGKIEGYDLRYMPTAVLLKTPLPLLGALFVSMFARLPRSHKNHVLPPEEPHNRPFVLGVAAALFFFLFVTLSALQIGARHLLPSLLILPLAAGSLAGLNLWRRKWAKVATGLCAVWLIAGTINVSPFPIAYFNVLAGGPSGGSKWFVDSALDWGQGLKALGDWQMEHPKARPLRLAYFGTDRPEKYGIEYQGLPSPLSNVRADYKVNGLSFPIEEKGWFAISETQLKGVYNQHMGLPNDYYSDFELEMPVDVVAYSIRIYHRE